MNTHLARVNRAPIFGDIAERVARYKTYRSTLNELQTLTDRELTDLGIARADVRRVAHQAAYGG